MNRRKEVSCWVTRLLLSLCAFVLIFLVGAKGDWLSVSKAEQITDEERTWEERAYEAAVLGQTRPDATSGELIDAAVTRGDIGSEQGLLYSVYLACGDPRLPAQFRGLDVSPPAKNVLWEAAVDWTALSPRIQESLRAVFNSDPAALADLTCRDDLAWLKGDASVWWAPALEEPTPAGLAIGD